MKIYNGNIKGVSIASWNHRRGLISNGARTSKMIEVEEYLVKFKNFSYLHCQWLTEQELTRGDKRINGKIKRFHQKRDKSGNVLDFCDEEPFNPDYVEVDRVLDASEHTDEQTKVSCWSGVPGRAASVVAIQKIKKKNVA